jgi:hypothetical protein
MSYDILVFDPAHAPKERKGFLDWWDAQADWSEPHPYNDPAFTTPSLQAWFMDMIERFPALNGPYASPRKERAADYCIGYHLIYMAIWFDKQLAHEKAHELAGKYRLGFFEASSPDGEIWLPGESDQSVLASKEEDDEGQLDLSQITDPRIKAFVESLPNVVVWTQADADNPKRTLNVVYGVDSSIEALTRSAPVQRPLAKLLASLSEEGKCYAVVEDHEHREFAKLLHRALSAARKRSADNS